jgi:ribonuclease-3 family protein
LEAGITHGTGELAYLGDAVFELMVRDMLLKRGIPAGDMFEAAKGYVSAPAQAAMYTRIFDKLPPEEQALLKRGRNFPKGDSDYCHATGLEVLFGHLHAAGKAERLAEVFEFSIGTEKQA